VLTVKAAVSSASCDSMWARAGRSELDGVGRTGVDAAVGERRETQSITDRRSR
jgi:hypothetical protein